MITRIAWRNLYRNKRRTIASLFTIALGTAGLLSYQGFQNGMMNQYRENAIRAFHSHGQVFTKDYYDKVLEKPWTQWIDNHQEIEDKIKHLDGVIDTFPRIYFYSFVQNGDITIAGRGQGIKQSRENNFFTEMNFEKGNNIQNDTQAILGKGLAKSLNVDVGDMVTILAQTTEGQLNGVDVEVVGIFHTGSKPFDDSVFRINLSVAKSLLDTDKVELIALRTEGVHVWDKIAAQAGSKFSDMDFIPFEEIDADYYKNAVSFLNAQFTFIRLIILLIVGLGIFNIISNGLMERKGEVGSLRANGEQRSRLMRILVLETIFLGSLGGIIGCIAAKSIDVLFLTDGIKIPPGPGLTRSFYVLLEIEVSHYVSAIVLPVITTILSGFYPILRLTRESIPALLRSNV